MRCIPRLIARPAGLVPAVDSLIVEGYQPAHGHHYTHQIARRTRCRHRSLLRRLGRRHAVGRHAVDQHLGTGRQRHRHVSRLSGRDSRSARHEGGRERFSDSLCQHRDLHARRSGRRAGGDEPGGAGDQPGRPGDRRHPDRQQRRLRRKRHGAGRLQNQSAGRRQPGRLSTVSGRDDPADAAGRRRAGAGTERKRPLPQLLRDGADLLALRSLARTDAALHRRKVRQDAGRGRGQPPGPARPATTMAKRPTPWPASSRSTRPS